MRYLENLPSVASTASVAMTHGSLADRFEYVRTPQQARQQLQELRTKQPTTNILILGHTHQPWAFSEGGGTRLRAWGERVSLHADQYHLLNPGSVGQSRQRSSHARYMLLDLAKRQATFHAVAYDVEACKEDLRRYALPVEACHRRPPFAAKPRRAVASFRRLLKNR
jgi:predicted phosphodiesterase